jgi:hypothetical protein
VRFRPKFPIGRAYNVNDFESIRQRARVVTTRILNAERNFVGNDEEFINSNVSLVKNYVFGAINEVEESASEYLEDCRISKTPLPRADSDRFYMVCFRTVEMGESVVEHFLGVMDANASNQ